MPKEELKSPPRRTLTKRLIREALLELLKTKSIQKISVRELCDAAGINRMTFYNHYDGTYEVLAEIEEHFLAQLSVEETAPGTTLDLEHHIELLCTRLQKNKEVSLLLLENNADPHFSDKLMAVRSCGTVWKQLGDAYTEDELLLLGDFLSSGAYALVFRWLKNGCRQSPKQVAELLAKIIRYGVALPEF